MATLTGNQLAYRGQQTSIELTIQGNEMTGSMTGRANIALTLAKQRR